MLIGIGNAARGDDAFGRLVARQLRGRLPEDVLVHETDGEAAALLELFTGLHSLWLVDAVRSGARPGTLLRLDAARDPLPAGLRSLSSHGLGLVEAIELARSLERLPPHCVIHAAEAGSFAHGAALSPEVARALPALVERIVAEIGAGCGEGAGGA